MNFTLSSICKSITIFFTLKFNAKPNFLHIFTDKNVLTENLYFDCDRIEYCFADHTSDLNSFVESDCDTNEWFELTEDTWSDDGNGTMYRELIIKEEDIGGGKSIYYRSVDKGENVESLNRRTLRIRDTEFVDPEFTVSTLQE